jgi:2-phospho-L-lactate transferase/gluconeogenesis factor (CofD/UPF0052 family)
VNIVIFCGGRGSSNLIREILGQHDVNLTLIVNAYDDGLSTGEIRRLIPGMLGPSDFRKNLSLLLVPASKNHLVFSKILEHRLQVNEARGQEFAATSGNIFKGKSKAETLINSDPELMNLIGLLSSKQRKIVLGLMNAFLNQINHKDKTLEAVEIARMHDYAIGNILLAGAYINNENSFSKANDYICSIFDIGARILNVSDENRYLVGLTRSGEFVEGEARIVGGKFNDKLEEIYLVEQPLTEMQSSELDKIQSLQEKKLFLESLEKIPLINSNIQAALNSADVVVFGSGTQHSSLFPSYKVLSHNGLTPLTWGGAKRIFIGNLDYDLDIEGWSGSEILRAFSKYFGGKPYSEMIDVIIAEKDSPIKFLGEITHPTLQMVSLRSGSNEKAHDGQKLYQQILSTNAVFNQGDCEILITTPSSGIEYSAARSQVNRWDFKRYTRDLSCEVTTSADPSRSAIVHYNEWIKDKTRSRFLVLYACEGETNLDDLIAGVDLMEASRIGVLNASRTQARHQWLTATGKTYGEGRFRFNLSIIATICAVILCIIRRKQLLTDPLSRCLILDRYELNSKNNFKEYYSGKTIPGLRTFLMCQNIDVAEFPIHYKVFKGFRFFVNPTRDAINGFMEIMKLPK